MKKLLFLLFSVASLSSCQASWLVDNRTPLEKCIGAATLLLGTLSTIDRIKDRDSVEISTDVLRILKKDLQGAQDAQDLFEAIVDTDIQKKRKNPRELLKNNPNLHINARFGDSKRTSLMQCCSSFASSNLTQDILNHPKLDITVKSKAGWTCLHYACNKAVYSLGKLFLGREDIGSILNEKTYDGKTPLDMLFGYITAKSFNKYISDINLWCKMVRQGAVLGKCKQDYNKLTLSNKTYNNAIEAIIDNPPRDMQVQDEEQKEGE